MSWRLKSPITWLFIHQLVQANSNRKKSRLCITGPLWGESLNEGPAMWKAFPCHDVKMRYTVSVGIRTLRRLSTRYMFNSWKRSYMVLCTCKCFRFGSLQHNSRNQKYSGRGGWVFVHKTAAKLQTKFPMAVYWLETFVCWCVCIEFFQSRW